MVLVTLVPSVNTAEYCYVFAGYVYVCTGCFNMKIRSRPVHPSRQWGRGGWFVGKRAGAGGSNGALAV